MYDDDPSRRHSVGEPADWLVLVIFLLTALSIVVALFRSL